MKFQRMKIKCYGEMLIVKSLLVTTRLGSRFVDNIKFVMLLKIQLGLSWNDLKAMFKLLMQNLLEFNMIHMVELEMPS